MSKIMNDSTGVNGAVNSTAAQSATGLSGGLDGLRELIKIRQEMAKRTNATNVATSSNSQTSGNGQSGDSNKRRRKRGRKNNNQSADKAVRVPLPSSIKLPFSSRDIVYAEIIESNQDSDAKLYVEQDGKLLVYSKQLYQNNPEYIESARALIIGGNSFLSSKVENCRIYINKNKPLIVENGELTYHDKYQIVCSNERILNVATEMITNRVKFTKPANDKKVIDKVEETAEAEIVEKSHQPQKPERDLTSEMEVVEKILAVQKVAYRMFENQATPQDLMEVFLIVQIASTDLATRILGLDAEMAESLIDQLRRMHALGRRENDGTYPILIETIEQLGSDVGYNLQSQADNFRSAVHTESVRGKKLVYDLDELFMVKAADEYIEQLAKYCRATRDSRIVNLFNQSNGEVKASEVLVTVSADKDLAGLNTAEYDLFHSYITKYMLASGWLINNPSDGFPWFQFNVKNTNGLIIDTMRYLLSNINWIKEVYSNEALASLSAQIATLNVDDVYGSHAMINYLVEALSSSDEKSFKVALNQLSLDVDQVDDKDQEAKDDSAEKSGEKKSSKTKK